MNREEAVLEMLNGHKIRNNDWYEGEQSNYVYCEFKSNGNVVFMYKGTGSLTCPLLNALRWNNGYYSLTNKGE